MDPLTLGLVLIAAMLHAAWNAVVKGGDVLLRMALVGATATVCALPLALTTSAPDRASWGYLAGSVLVHQAYYGFLVLGYRIGDLSQVYPIARGSAPLLVAVGAFVVAGEALTPVGIAAVVLICVAIMSLSLTGVAPDDVRAVLFALATGVMIATYTVLDGLGGRNAGDVAGYVAWLFVLEGIPFVVVALILRRHGLLAALRRHAPTAVPGGAAAFIAYGVVIWAMSRTAMTYVSALRETSVIVAAWIGTRLLDEPLGTRRTAAAVVIAIGVVVLQVTQAG
jgi:drug/metabolite transporter (DMT)-like permease